MITQNEREAVRQEVIAELLAEKRDYKTDWRAKNKDRIKESNRKYYEKKKAERLGEITPIDYRKSLNRYGFIEILCEGKHYRWKTLPTGHEMWITGMNNPSEKAIIEVRKDNILICKCAKVEHTELVDIVNFLEKRVKWS